DQRQRAKIPLYYWKPPEHSTRQQASPFRVPKIGLLMPFITRVEIFRACKQNKGDFRSDNPLGHYLLYVATRVRQSGDARLAQLLAGCFGPDHKSDLLKPLVGFIFRAATSLFREARKELQPFYTGWQEKRDFPKQSNKIDDEYSSSDEGEKHNWGYHNADE